METVSGDTEPSFLSATKPSLVMMNVRMYIRKQFFLFVQDDSRHDGTKKVEVPARDGSCMSVNFGCDNIVFSQ